MVAELDQLTSSRTVIHLGKPAFASTKQPLLFGTPGR